MVAKFSLIGKWFQRRISSSWADRGGPAHNAKTAGRALQTMARQIVGDNLRIKFTTSVLASLSQSVANSRPANLGSFRSPANYSKIELLGLGAVTATSLVGETIK